MCNDVIMDLDDFEVTDYKSDLHDDFFMDELEVGNVVSIIV